MSIQFTDSQAIYLQIADFIGENILKGFWKPQERIPSVRELAVEMEVNPNTVMRTFEFLQNEEIIFNKRGIGYFVTENAISMILKNRKLRFIQQQLPDFFKNIFLLNISMEEIIKLYNEYLKNNHIKEEFK